MRRKKSISFSGTCAAYLLAIATVTGICSLLCSCEQNQRQATKIAMTTGPQDDSEALHAQNDHQIKVEVTARAPVYKLLPDDTRGLPHQKFLISLSNGTTVLIAHDTKMAARVPIQPGDSVRIHGEYIWNASGGLIHWTHHTDTPRHEGGWIEFDGKRYE